MNSAYLGDYRAIAKTQLGTKIFVDTRDRQVAPHILLDGEWEGWMTRVMHPYLKNSVFFDVGANYGWYGLVAHHAHARKIISFEPNREVFKLLEDTMKLNGIPSELHQKGVGSSETICWMYSDASCPGSSSFLRQPEDQEEAECDERWRPCVLVTLDAVAADLYDREPELKRCPVVLKVDVEGFEPQVVLGAKNLLSRRSPSITAFIEHHQDPDNKYGFTDMLDFLAAEGFTMNLVAHDECIQKITREQLGSIPDAEMLCFRRLWE